MATAGPRLPPRYRPMRRIATGGFAEVLLVEDAVGRPARRAMKILLPALPADLVAGFRDEFRLLASLDHPGLARVFEFGQLEDGRAFYTAEYIEGRQLGAGRRISVRDACVAVAAVCRTLAYLHARGYLHNDIKPANILIPDRPEGARLLDFGLAGIAREPTAIVLGTPGYVAPERLARSRWDARADLYAVGATLYRVLAGRRLVEEPTADRALATLRRGWPPLAQVARAVPAAVSHLVERLLALEPAARPPNATTVVALIREALGEPIPLETPGTARCYALASAFQGRDDHVAALEAALGTVRAGAGPRLLLVASPEGTGKTRLGKELAWRAETGGWQVAWIDGSGSPGLDRIAGQVAAQLGGAATEPGPPDVAGLILEGARRGPVLLVLDGIHAAPDATWRKLAGLVHRSASAGLPAAILATVEPDHLSSTARQVVALLGTAGHCLSIDLPPLAPGDVRRLVDSLFGPGVIPERLSDEIVARSSGAPLLVEEIVREMVESGRIRSTPAGWTAGRAREDSGRSDRLDGFLQRRCHGLGNEARSILAVIGALGGRPDRSAIAAVAGAATDVQMGLGELLDRSLVVLAGESVALTHQALAGLALAGMDRARRIELHRAAARWLAEHGADDADRARVARAAEDLEGWRRHAEAAGDAALAAGDGRRAVHWMEEAVRAAGARNEPGPATASLHARLGDALDLVGRKHEAIAALGRAFELSGSARSAASARIATRAARAALRIGDFSLAGAWLERARARVPSRDAAVAGELDSSEGTAAWVCGRHREARDRLARAIQRLEAGEPAAAPGRAALFMNAAIVESYFDLPAACDLARRAVSEAEAAKSPLASSARQNLSWLDAMRGGSVSIIADALRAATDEYDRTGAVEQLCTILRNLAVAEHRRGNWRAATEALDRGFALAQASGNPLDGAALRSAAAFNAWWDGDPERVRRNVPEALADPSTPVLLLAIGASAAADLGLSAEAATLAAEAEARAKAARAPLEDLRAGLARTYARAPDDPGAAGAALVKVGEALAEFGWRADLGAVYRDAARWFALGGQAASTAACLERARAATQAPDLPPGRLDEIRQMLEATPSARAAPPDPISALLAEVERRVRAAPPEKARPAAVLAALDAALGRRGQARPSREGTSAVDPPESPAAASAPAEASRLLELTLGGQVSLRHPFPDIVGRGPGMMRVLSVLDRLSESDVPVLIAGETGTGKEVFARALHAASRRAGGPFVPVNCAAVPASLFEAELFGYRRGAFSGADRDRPGLAQEAHGGILFLDEVSELPEPLQAKLLRLVQDRRVRPLGGRREIPVDFRLLAASNKDLAAEVGAGRFRQDLYYRIAVFELGLPPLRERPEDIPTLCAHLLDRHGSPDQRIAQGAMRRILDHAWPGNVRELENEMRRASVLARGGTIQARHLSARLLDPRHHRTPGAEAGAMTERVAAVEREVLGDVLAKVKGNRSQAARLLGMSRYGLRLKLQRLGLAPRGRQRRG